jgi:hypothetical protein
MPLFPLQLVPKKLLTLCVCFQESGGHKSVKLGRNAHLHWVYNLTKNHSIVGRLGLKSLSSMFISCGITNLCSFIALEVCDKSGTRVVNKVKHLRHCICIFCHFCHSFHCIPHTYVSGTFSCSCGMVKIKEMHP